MTLMLSIIELNHLFRDKRYLTGLLQTMKYVPQLKNILESFLSFISYKFCSSKNLNLKKQTHKVHIL